MTKRPFFRKLVSVSMYVCLLGLASCASRQTVAASGSEPQPAWSKKYYKVGARLYPRCARVYSTGSRINNSVYCMTDEEIAGLDNAQRDMKVDLMRRQAIHLGPGGG